MDSSRLVVGVTRLELVASWSRTKHATKLRYTPIPDTSFIIPNLRPFVKTSGRKNPAKPEVPGRRSGRERFVRS